jgi:hypothetical protein
VSANRIKQRHGESNPVFLQEERIMIAEVEKALEIGNAQIIGRNGELPLLSFFNRYLPSTFRAVTGKFITPSGVLSPQIDIMVVDSRYPLLSQNKDGSVVVMLHSLIETIEVKTNIGKREVVAMLKSTKRLHQLILQVFPPYVFGTVSLAAIAYKSSLTRKTICRHVFDDEYSDFNLTLLRIKENKNPNEPDHIGVLFHNEPSYQEDPTAAEYPSEWTSMAVRTLSPLSDFYYDLVRNGYYALDARGFDFGSIGKHMLVYMSTGAHFKPFEKRR